MDKRGLKKASQAEGIVYKKQQKERTTYLNNCKEVRIAKKLYKGNVDREDLKIQSAFEMA